MPFNIDLFRIKPGRDLDLSSWDTNETIGWDSEDRDGAEKATKKLNKKIEALQETLYAEGKQRLLFVLQAMDAGGKDGTIRAVFDRVNPAGVKTAAFKAPNKEELAHDYLWRIHQETPRKGEITIFNRSHYEDVLIVRVQGFAPRSVWSKRYDHIRNFEQMLADEGTRIVKIMLHISKDEQKERLQSRLDEPHKNWKFDAGDLQQREKWADYMAAFEDAVMKTSTDDAPWFVIPADRKWYRNLVISEILVQTLEDMNPQFPPAPPGLDKIEIV
jgi:PPK2 family polyphosphate:nucleotide phosphotransferase